MSDEIQPALTPDAWATVLRRGDASYFASTEDVSDHAKAALYLHGQSFGFTHAHVARLRSLVDAVRRADYVTAYLLTGDVLRIADRIAALLPPNA